MLFRYLAVLVFPLLLVAAQTANAEDLDDDCHTHNQCVADCAKVEPEFCGDPAEYCRDLPESCSSGGCSFAPVRHR